MDFQTEKMPHYRSTAIKDFLSCDPQMLHLIDCTFALEAHLTIFRIGTGGQPISE